MANEKLEKISILKMKYSSIQQSVTDDEYLEIRRLEKSIADLNIQLSKINDEFLQEEKRSDDINQDINEIELRQRNQITQTSTERPELTKLRKVLEERQKVLEAFRAEGEKIDLKRAVNLQHSEEEEAKMTRSIEPIIETPEEHEQIINDLHDINTAPSVETY